MDIRKCGLKRRPEMNEQLFGARIKARREEIGLSQREFAEALDLDQGKVSLIESGKRKVDVVTELPLIAKTLSCSIDWLFREDQPEACNQVETPENGTERFLRYYFPTMKFNELDVKRIDKLLQAVTEGYIETVNIDPRENDSATNR